jgi:hypothetical protein
MSDSIFKEVTLTPHIFESSNLLNDDRKFERLLNALEDLAESGQLIGVFFDWFEKINNNILELSEDERDEIEEILKYLNDRQRIVCIQNKISNSNDENFWIEEALKFNKIRNFELILATKQKDIIKSFETIDRRTIKALGYKGAKVLAQTKENMKKLLMPILAYAEIVKIYDPYFDFTKQRYIEAFEIICETLSFKHGNQESAIIEIHTSIKTILDKNDLINTNILNIFSEKLIDFEKLYKHEITIRIWEDRENNKWHDRWIVTNQCGINLGKGSDTSKWTDATWGIVDYEEIPNIQKKFLINRNEFNLIYTISKNGYKKENNSIKYAEPKTEEEITEKLKSVKSFSSNERPQKKYD